MMSMATSASAAIFREFITNRLTDHGRAGSVRRRKRVFTLWYEILRPAVSWSDATAQKISGYLRAGTNKTEINPLFPHHPDLSREWCFRRATLNKRSTCRIRVTRCRLL
jgi:hypothetical protein